MEKEKVDRMLSWLEPKNMKDVRKFLGLTNYFRRFIKDFAWVARCYESPKKETVSHAFKHLIQNLKSYNEVKV